MNLNENAPLPFWCQYPLTITHKALVCYSCIHVGKKTAAFCRSQLTNFILFHLADIFVQNDGQVRQITHYKHNLSTGHNCGFIVSP